MANSVAPPLSLVKSFPAHDATINALSFSPDNEWLASAGADKLLGIWKPTSGGRDLNPIKSFSFHASVNALTWTGAESIVAGLDCGELFEISQLFDGGLAPRYPVKDVAKPVNALAFGSDQHLIAVGFESSVLVASRPELGEVLEHVLSDC